MSFINCKFLQNLKLTFSRLEQLFIFHFAGPEDKFSFGHCMDREHLHTIIISGKLLLPKAPADFVFLINVCIVYVLAFLFFSFLVPFAF